jgi:hypothetical protein
MLFGDLFALACRGVGWELKLSIVGFEHLHAANRVRSRPLMRWHVLAAAMVSGERQTHATKQRRQQDAARLEMHLYVNNTRCDTRNTEHNKTNKKFLFNRCLHRVKIKKVLMFPPRLFK